MSNALALTAAGIFLLCSYSTGCREAIHDEFLLAEPCKCHCQWSAKIFGCW